LTDTHSLEKLQFQPSRKILDINDSIQMPADAPMIPLLSESSGGFINFNQVNLLTNTLPSEKFQISFAEEEEASQAIRG
jgi:hypothetical protein